jgi:hypothetical protein
MLFNYDYKLDLQKTAVEREKIFKLNKIREDTQESEDEFANLQPEAREDKPEQKPSAAAVITSKAPEVRTQVQQAEDSEEDLGVVEFPEELPKQFANFGKFGDVRT